MNQVDNTSDLQQAIDKVAQGMSMPAPATPTDGSLPSSSSPEATLAAINAEAAPEASVAAESASAVSPSIVTSAPVLSSAPAAGPLIADVTPVASVSVGSEVGGESVASAPEVSVAPENDNGEDLSEVRKNILNDLIPLMDHVNLEPEKKFELYKEMIAVTGDRTMIKGAYATAREIVDESLRARSLMEIMQMIDAR